MIPVVKQDGRFGKMVGFILEVIHVFRQHLNQSKRQFIAQTVLSLGYGGESLAEREYVWDKCTIRKGMHELKSGINCVDNYSARGRKKIEEHLPQLLKDRHRKIG